MTFERISVEDDVTKFGSRSTWQNFSQDRLDWIRLNFGQGRFCLIRPNFGQRRLGQIWPHWVRAWSVKYQSGLTPLNSSAGTDLTEHGQFSIAAD